MDEGKAGFLGGGVEGGAMRVRDVGLAGDGEVAKYSSKSAPSSPSLPFLSLFRRLPLPRLRIGEGVRGGDERMWLNEWTGSEFSSSSDRAAKLVD
jgi:hypothetical protein